MNYTVFYSWQSDLENRFNRSFIEDALEKAVKSISQIKGFSIDAVIDRDTYGIPGSPSIVESITSKIARADIFVCDVSIINNGEAARPTPNPNVLFELGYASAILGWDRIIMVQNIAFGGVEKLPFDLKGRRILQYKVDAFTEERAEEKKKLKGRLLDTFADAFKYYVDSVLDTKEKIAWWGNWNLVTKSKAHGGNIHISRVSSDAFFFDLTVFDGARSGQAIGKAQLLTPHSAYARIKSFSDEDCEINFRRRLDGNTWHIEVEEGPACQSLHGHNTSFGGIYAHAPESVVNWGYLDEIDLNEIERLTGDFLPVFLDNFQQISIDQYTDKSEFKVITAGVKGMYTIMESIVILDDRGGIWCACLDANDEVVRYFTNTGDDFQPKPIQDWLSKFSDRPLVINVPVDPRQSRDF